MKALNKKRTLPILAIAALILIALVLFFYPRPNYNNPAFQAYYKQYEYCVNFFNLPGTPQEPIHQIYKYWQANREIGC